MPGSRAIIGKVHDKDSLINRWWYTKLSSMTIIINNGYNWNPVGKIGEPEIHLMLHLDGSYDTYDDQSFYGTEHGKKRSAILLIVAQSVLSISKYFDSYDEYYNLLHGNSGFHIYAGEIKWPNWKKKDAWR
jgi:hypothetical protein